jgi:hypothetical protein
MRSKFVLATAVASVLSCAVTEAAHAGTVRALDVAQAGIGRAQTDAGSDARTRDARSSFSPGGNAEEPSDGRYLPSARENFELVGKFDVPNVFDGQIADVAMHKGWAYLNSWDDPQCQRGGVYVVDARDPANPKPGPFLPAVAPYYHGEGAHALSLSTPQFTGDLLAVNNETYSAACGGPNKTGGGFDLYDVSNPADPKVLVQVAGDRGGDGVLEPQDQARPNSYHSVFVWQDGPRAYLVGVDNTELADVDVFDITDPRAPEQIGDYNLAQRFPQILDGLGNGRQVFHHDVVVKRIGGRSSSPTRTSPAPTPCSGSRPPRATPTRASTPSTTSSSWPRTRTSRRSAARSPPRTARGPGPRSRWPRATRPRSRRCRTRR